MSDFIVDSEMRKKLNGLNETIRVRDEHGNTLGRFVPEGEFIDLLYIWAHKEFADKDERAKALAEPGGYTTAEAIKYLNEVARKPRGPGS